MGIERGEWNGEKSIDEQTETPRLSTPLKVFFDDEKIIFFSQKHQKVHPKNVF